MQEYVKTEKEVLQMFNHPFLLSMDFAYENENRIYFFLEFIKGGNLRELI